MKRDTDIRCRKKLLLYLLEEEAKAPQEEKEAWKKLADLTMLQLQRLEKTAALGDILACYTRTHTFPPLFHSPWTP